MREISLPCERKPELPQRELLDIRKERIEALAD
jgi:hypothetical protein